MKKRLVPGGLLTLANGLRQFVRGSTSYLDAGPSAPAGDADPTPSYATLRIPGGVLYLKPTTAAAFRRLPKDRSYMIDHEAALSETQGEVVRLGWTV
ncbi:MAG: hypothetical protein ACRYFX_16095 [Janthinobacterium lividum]